MLHPLVVLGSVLVHKSHALGVGIFKSSGSCRRRAAGHVGRFAKEEGTIQQREMQDGAIQKSMQREAWDS